jgi:hypothetical protein
MGNPTMAKRLDRKVIGPEILGIVNTVQPGPLDAARPLGEKGALSMKVEGASIRLSLLREGRCLVVEPRGEPGWTLMFEICREYADREGVTMVLFDEEYTHCVAVDGKSTLEQVRHTVQSDPYQAERMIKGADTA